MSTLKKIIFAFIGMVISPFLSRQDKYLAAINYKNNLCTNINDAIVIKTKRIVLPYGFSFVPEVTNEAEKQKLIQAIKENRDIVFIYHDGKDFAEYGCLASVCISNRKYSFVQQAQKDLLSATPELENAGDNFTLTYKKSDLVKYVKNNQQCLSFFNGDTSNLELLLHGAVRVIMLPENKMNLTVQPDLEESIDPEYAKIIGGVCQEKMDENDFFCIHSPSFFALSLLFPQTTAETKYIMTKFLQMNSENARLELLIDSLKK
jgi:hypothetical protein